MLFDSNISSTMFRSATKWFIGGLQTFGRSPEAYQMLYRYPILERILQSSNKRRGNSVPTIRSTIVIWRCIYVSQVLFIVCRTCTYDHVHVRGVTCLHVTLQTLLQPKYQWSCPLPRGIPQLRRENWEGLTRYSKYKSPSWLCGIGKSVEFWRTRT